MVEQESVEYVRAGFKRAHHVPAVVNAEYAGIQGARNVDSRELLVDKLETVGATGAGKTVVAVRPLLVEAHDFSEVVNAGCVCRECSRKVDGHIFKCS